MIPGSNSFFGKQASSGITYIGNAGENVSTGAQTITYNASSAAGDFLMLFVESDNADTAVTPAGWTILINRTAASECRATLYYKFKGTDTTVFLSDFGDHTEASVLTFRGVNPSAINNHLSAEEATANACNIAGVTTTVDNCFVMYAVYHSIESDTNGQLSGWTNAAISSSSELIDICTSVGWDGGFAVWGGYLLHAGASGTTTANISDITDRINLCVALTPA